MRLAPDPIPPVRKTRDVPLPVDAAFELFTARMGEWWPTLTHSIAESEAVEVRFEGRVGGRILEIAAGGATYSWADVIAWDPPHRFVVAWHPNPEPEAASIIEVRFTPLDDGARVELEHRGWEEFGAEAGAAIRAGYDGGWDEVLAPFTERAAAPARR